MDRPLSGFMLENISFQLCDNKFLENVGHEGKSFCHYISLVYKLDRVGTAQTFNEFL